MKTVAVVVAAVHLCVVAAAQSEPQKVVYSGPDCLADFCLFKSPLPSEDALVVKYGPGTQVGEVRCYAVPEQKAYVHFSTQRRLPGQIVAVFVSRAQNCFQDSGKPVTAKSPFPLLATKEGIRLGDQAQKVVEAYGTPSTKREGADGLGQIVPSSRRRQGEPFGEHVLVYDGPPGELMQSKFYIHNGKVSAIYLSCSE